MQPWKVELGLMPRALGLGVGVGERLGEGALPTDLSLRAFVSTESADLAIFLLTLAMTSSPTRVGGGYYGKSTSGVTGCWGRGLGGLWWGSHR